MTPRKMAATSSHGRAVLDVLKDGAWHDTLELRGVWEAAGGVRRSFMVTTRGRLRNGLLETDGNGSVRQVEARRCGRCDKPIPGPRYARELVRVLVADDAMVKVKGNRPAMSAEKHVRFLCVSCLREWLEAHGMEQQAGRMMNCMAQEVE